MMNSVTSKTSLTPFNYFITINSIKLLSILLLPTAGSKAPIVKSSNLESLVTLFQMDKIVKTKNRKKNSKLPQQKDHHNHIENKNKVKINKMIMKEINTITKSLESKDLISQLKVTWNKTKISNFGPKILDVFLDFLTS